MFGLAKLLNPKSKLWIVALLVEAIQVTTDHVGAEIFRLGTVRLKTVRLKTRLTNKPRKRELSPAKRVRPAQRLG